jgi:hypothetical protein
MAHAMFNLLRRQIHRENTVLLGPLSPECPSAWAVFGRPATLRETREG